MLSTSKMTGAATAIVAVMTLLLQHSPILALAPVQLHSQLNTNKVRLAAVPPSSAGGQPWGSRGVPSRTACEGAVNVEWEPMTELERRIEDGVNYEHITTTANESKTRTSREHSKHDGIPSSRGVFCGYRYTDNEYNRLKSAHPNELSEETRK